MATDGYEKRKRLFDRFSKQLHLLRDKGIIEMELKYDRTYICPICLEQFSETDLQQQANTNYLTLEDAPPDSLKGSKIALTCKKCNNECGHKVDFHLTEVIREIDASYFYKGSTHQGYVDFEGKRLSIQLTSEGNGTLQAYHRIKQNNPTLLEKFIFGLKTGNPRPVLNFQPPKSRVDSRKVNYALVKANYIITFSKFGYIFLLDKAYDPLREQLLNPDKIIYPWAPFIKDQFESKHTGTYYVQNTRLESILNVFSLRTEYSETMIGGLLSFPTVHIEELGKRIDHSKDANQEIVFDTRNYDPDADMFGDFTEIKKVNRWIKGIT